MRWLRGRRRARSDVAGSDKRNGHGDAGNFEMVAGRNHFDHRGWSGDRGPCRGADWANVGIERTGVQIHAAMQLRREKYGSEEKRQVEKLF